MIKLCDLSQSKKIYKIITQVIDSGVFIKGPKVEEFELKWAQKCQMKYCVATDSGSMALEILCQILKPKSTFPWTYKAVWNAMDRIIGSHQFNEKDPDIYAHHLHDQKPNYIPMIEDCSHCHGYKPVSENAIFSFYPTKILGACGDAGSIVTNNKDIYLQSKYLIDHGNFGTNGRMDEIQAAILIEKLKNLDNENIIRKQIVDLYDSGLNIKTPGSFHYVYAIKGSQDKLEKLKIKGIESKFYYNEEYMALPLYSKLKSSEIKEVIECVQQL